MSDVFRIATVRTGGRCFSALVLDDESRLFDIEGLWLHRAMAAGRTTLPAFGLLHLLRDWDRNFEALSQLVQRLKVVGESASDLATIRHKAVDLQFLAPVIRPPKMLYAAANYREHVAGMRKTFRQTMPAIDPAKDYKAEKSQAEPYHFLKAGTTLAGAFDDVVIPPGMERIDWEAELGVVIGAPGKNIPPARVAHHIAGYVTTNDISCRDRTWRPDRPGIRSDWLSGKSWDTFAPTGPYFVPKAFVPDHADLRITCSVNGEIKQDGNSSDMVFNIEDQIEYASRMMTLESGDMIATGTPAGTGQERLEFLKPGDVLETEVEGLGRQRNVLVAGTTDYSNGLAVPI
jgi:2,4-diketo-3-deoxy-L-fuconate hydrolase